MELNNNTNAKNFQLISVNKKSAASYNITHKVLCTKKKGFTK